MMLAVALAALVPSASFAAETGQIEYATVAPGVKVLRLWETVGPQWPQIAVIELSLEMHREFHQAPMAAFNRYKIFPQPVRTLGKRCDAIDEKTFLGPGVKANGWVIIGTHSSNSTVT